MSSGSKGKARSVSLIVLVCGAGAIVGSLFGLLAALGYQLNRMVTLLPELPRIWTVGGVSGGLGGLLAGIIWCGVMIPRAIHGRHQRLVLSGTWCGILVGLLCTAILHVALVFTAGRFDPPLYVMGAILGVLAGAATGAICGRACKAVLLGGQEADTDAAAIE